MWLGTAGPRVDQFCRLVPEGRLASAGRLGGAAEPGDEAASSAIAGQDVRESFLICPLGNCRTGKGRRCLPKPETGVGGTNWEAWEELELWLCMRRMGADRANECSVNF